MKIFSSTATSHLLPFAFCLCFFCCATISDPPITETTLKNSNNILRETFDPAALRDDLFVIQPTFSRDEIQFTIVDTTKTTGEILQPINTLIEQESSFTSAKKILNAIVESMKDHSDFKSVRFIIDVDPV